MLSRAGASLGVLAVLVGGSSACTRARAEVAPEPLPILEPPPAPPRVVAEYAPDPAPQAPAPEVPVVQPPTPRANGRREPPPPVAVTPAPTPPPPPAGAAPALSLQSVGGDTSKSEAAVRTLLSSAQRDLGRVDYQALDADGRAQYDTARRFMQQAEEALKARNLVFAGKLADKAAAMATTLVR
jgi:hypothetical protein